MLQPHNTYASRSRHVLSSLHVTSKSGKAKIPMTLTTQSKCVGETYDDIMGVPGDVKDALRYKNKLLFLLPNVYAVTMSTSTAQHNI